MARQPRVGLSKNRESPQQALAAYRARWKLANEKIIELDRRVPILERYRGFLQMVEMTKAMNWFTSTPEENAEVARRWRRLREIDRGQKENGA
jgi:hypothetical protein